MTAHIDGDLRRDIDLWMGTHEVTPATTDLQLKYLVPGLVELLREAAFESEELNVVAFAMLMCFRDHETVEMSL